MIPQRIEGATRPLGAPVGWEERKDPLCQVLWVRDEPRGGHNGQVSAWEPTPDELAALNRGAPVMLCILGVAHPVVQIYVGRPEGT